MLDEFAFLGEKLARKLVIENTNALAETFEPVEVVKGDLYTPFIDKAEETVAELTYKKAFEIYGNPLPDIVWFADWKGTNFYSGGMDLPWFI